MYPFDPTSKLAFIWTSILSVLLSEKSRIDVIICLNFMRSPSTSSGKQGSIIKFTFLSSVLLSSKLTEYIKKSLIENFSDSHLKSPHSISNTLFYKKKIIKTLIRIQKKASNCPFWHRIIFIWVLHFSEFFFKDLDNFIEKGSDFI